MAYVDIKITTWERIFIKDEDLDKVKSLMESGEISNPSDIWVHTEPELVEGIRETDEFMTPEDNDYQPTMELYTDDHTIVWDNDPRKLKTKND